MQKKKVKSRQDVKRHEKQIVTALLAATMSVAIVAGNMHTIRIRTGYKICRSKYCVGSKETDNNRRRITDDGLC